MSHLLKAWIAFAFWLHEAKPHVETSKTSHFATWKGLNSVRSVLCLFYGDKRTQTVGDESFYNTTQLCWEQHCGNRTWVLKLEVRDKAGSVSHLTTRMFCVTRCQEDSSQASFVHLIIAADWRHVSIRDLLPQHTNIIWMCNCEFVCLWTWIINECMLNFHFELPEFPGFMLGKTHIMLIFIPQCCKQNGLHFSDKSLLSLNSDT